MNDRELMQRALDALVRLNKNRDGLCNVLGEIEALRARLAQPEQEPVATVYDAYDTTGIDWHCKNAPSTGTKLYTAPPQRDEAPAKAVEWQGLTDEEIREFEIWLDDEEEKRGWNPPADIVKYIEAKLREKNT